MFLYLFYFKKYGIYIGCILFFYYYGDVNIEIYLVVCLYMNQVVVSFCIVGMIIVIIIKVYFLVSFGEYNVMSFVYCLFDFCFGEIWQLCKLRCFLCMNEM